MPRPDLSNLSLRRQARSLTQLEASREVECNVYTYARVERLQEKPSARVSHALERIYKTDIRTLLSRVQVKF